MIWPTLYRLTPRPFKVFVKFGAGLHGLARDVRDRKVRKLSGPA